MLRTMLDSCRMEYQAMKAVTRKKGIVARRRVLRFLGRFQRRRMMRMAGRVQVTFLLMVAAMKMRRERE